MGELVGFGDLAEIVGSFGGIGSIWRIGNIGDLVNMVELVERDGRIVKDCNCNLYQSI